MKVILNQENNLMDKLINNKGQDYGKIKSKIIKQIKIKINQIIQNKKSFILHLFKNSKDILLQKIKNHQKNIIKLEN